MPESGPPTLAPLPAAAVPERLEMPLRRPAAMRVDLDSCIGCGDCDDLAAGVRERPQPIAVTPASLEAMAACPVGAIVWLEGDRHEHDA